MDATQKDHSLGKVSESVNYTNGKHQRQASKQAKGKHMGVYI